MCPSYLKRKSETFTKMGICPKNTFLGFNSGGRLCETKDTFCTETKRKKDGAKTKTLFETTTTRTQTSAHSDSHTQNHAESAHAFRTMTFYSFLSLSISRSPAHCREWGNSGSASPGGRGDLFIT